MKRDLKKIEAVKQAIRRFSASVSDREIGQKFSVTLRSVAIARRRMGIKKSTEQSQELRRKAYKKNGGREPKSNFGQFWNG